MPHFIIDCSANSLTGISVQQIMTTVFDATRQSGLFEANDIKVRINPYVNYEVGGKSNDFIHVFGYILEGRTNEQKVDLSHRIVQSLVKLFPDIEVIASSIDEFTKVGYCNRNLLSL